MCDLCVTGTQVLVGLVPVIAAGAAGGVAGAKRLLRLRRPARMVREAETHGGGVGTAEAGK